MVPGEGGRSFGREGQEGVVGSLAAYYYDRCPVHGDRTRHTLTQMIGASLNLVVTLT